jgi:hypothetical protein
MSFVFKVIGIGLVLCVALVLLVFELLKDDVE